MGNGLHRLLVGALLFLGASASARTCAEFFQEVTRAEQWLTSHLPSRATDLHTHMGGILPFERFAYFYVNDVLQYTPAARQPYERRSESDRVLTEKILLLRRIFELVSGRDPRVLDPGSVDSIRDYLLSSLPTRWGRERPQWWVNGSFRAADFWEGPAFWQAIPETEIRSMVLRVSRAMPETRYDDVYRLNTSLITDARRSSVHLTPDEVQRLFCRRIVEYLRDSGISSEQGLNYYEVSLAYSMFLFGSRESGNRRLGNLVSPSAGAVQGDNVRLKWLLGVTNDYLWKRQEPRNGSSYAERLLDLELVLTGRNDVVGVDIFGGESHRLSDNPHGYERFKDLYQLLARVGKSNRKLVYRIHVGEGMVFENDGETSRAIARSNIETLLTWLEKLQSEGVDFNRGNVVFRLGHFTAATPEQVRRAATMGIYLEFPLRSNVVTGALERATGGGASIYDHHPLLLAIYHQARFVLATDGATVSHTSMESELRTMAYIVSRFRAGEGEIEVSRGVKKRYQDLAEAERQRFDQALDTMDRHVNDYRGRMGLPRIR